MRNMSFDLRDNSEVLQQRPPTDQANSHGINVDSIERWACAIGGGALTIYGLRRRTTGGLLLTLAGAALLHRGTTGHCNTYQAFGITTAEKHYDAAPIARDVHIEKSTTIDKSPAELYRFWREFENLPRFMSHLESVRRVGLDRWHWVAKGSLGTRVEWDAEIYNEKPNELIAWRSLEGADITNAGSVRFMPMARSTHVKVNLNYKAPGGKVSALMAKLFGQEPGQMIEEDLRRLKQVLETGGIATVEGRPSGRNDQISPLADDNRSKTASNLPARETEETRTASA